MRNRVARNPHHPGVIFEYPWFNRVNFAIPVRLETMGPDLIRQWAFLRTLDFSMYQITYLVVLHLYDSTMITHDMTRMIYVASQMHAEQLQRIDIANNLICNTLRANHPDTYCRMYLHQLERCCQLSSQQSLHQMCLQTIDAVIIPILVHMQFPCTRCSQPCRTNCNRCIHPFTMPVILEGQSSFRRACSDCRTCDTCH